MFLVCLFCKKGIILTEPIICLIFFILKGHLTRLALVVISGGLYFSIVINYCHYLAVFSCKCRVQIYVVVVVTITHAMTTSTIQISPTPLKTADLSVSLRLTFYTCPNNNCLYAYFEGLATIQGE